jgi:hypothetical protein
MPLTVGRTLCIIRRYRSATDLQMPFVGWNASFSGKNRNIYRDRTPFVVIALFL